MPQIDSGIIIFNILLTIGILFSARSSSKKALSNKDNQKIKKETKKDKDKDKDNRQNIYAVHWEQDFRLDKRRWALYIFGAIYGGDNNDICILKSY